MINRTQTFLAVVLTCVFSASSDAGTLRFAGVGIQPPNATTRSIELRIDLDPEDSFHDGGLVFSVAHDNSAVLKFTGATVFNPSSDLGDPGRWVVATAVATSSEVLFHVVALGHYTAFPTGAQNQLLATINYELTGFGRSNLSWIVGDESLVDGRGNGTDVTANYQYLPGFITSIVPEPSALTLLCLGLAGYILLALRRAAC